MLRTLTLVSLLNLVLPAFSSPCTVFDASFNLYALGLGGKDWDAGTQDAWASGQATDVTTTGRPPFDGANTTCYLAQFYNAIYVMNGDASNPSAVHIYDAGTKAWSTQSVTTGKFDPSNFQAILDHDTNVFYALSNDEMLFLDMGSLTTANSSALSWMDVGMAPYPSGYQPVMALAQNHVHFLDVPGNPPGEADIFVIHFSFFQPTPQAYPLPDGSAFPAEHGLTASFFQSSGVQQEFAFIPDDGSATYVINVETNTTQKLAGPTNKDPKANYAASITALVQLDSSGALSFLPYTEGDATTNSAAQWSSVANVAAAVPSGSISSASPSASGAAKASGTGSTSSKPTGSASGSGTGSAGASPTGAAQPNSGVMTSSIFSLGLVALGSLGFVASML
ncbi:uncharacterized protein PHACADRAFT_254322 [Phanerochaete carnosa HHB-10118-sp]|uniref:Uncharacterized protein n=1 Tax=Phanerochaete carnosa (strain HHB-10118-sp) TaxID=650164 RepID=K5V2Z5_PHACS|nr:uncharacterized protein PHACADRAFT_254322 [Phanerochaete carnosa HHB-10118-sp]EKM56926.1 hypothetical protein PHACADRAFT_254322 [Phanerochaete carnosa HHB-10118-sp]